LNLMSSEKNKRHPEDSDSDEEVKYWMKMILRY